MIRTFAVAAGFLLAFGGLMLLARQASDGATQGGRVHERTYRLADVPPGEMGARRFATLPAVRSRISLPRAGIETSPLSMTATSGLLLLVRPDRSVIALDSAGRVAWRRTATDLRMSPRLVVRADTQAVAVIGDAGDDLVILSARRGAASHRWPAPDHELIESGCFSREWSIVSTVTAGLPLSVLDTGGIMRRRAGLPWPGYASAHPLHRQVLLAGDEAGAHCAAALALGSRLAQLATGSARAAWTAPYREAFRPPDVRVRTTTRADRSVVIESELTSRARAASALAVGGGRVYVAFDGASELAGRLIDVYALSTGRYVGSYRFPRAIRGIAADRQRLWVSTYEDGVPVVLEYLLPT